jgi:dihydroorotate dehydrogenase electron transfer subunit
MRQTLAEVASIDAVGPFARIRFVAPDIAPAIEPGRAVLARSAHTYLRRTWWPCAIDADGFSVLVAGAEPDSNARIGDRIDVLGPIGRGFQVNDVCRNLLLVAAGSTAPEPDIGPLLALVDPALASGRSVTLAQAAPSDDRAYPVLALPPAIEVIRAIEADVVDRLDDALAWADQVFACGPRDFTARLADRIASIRMRVPRGFVQALNPIVLPCGVGACGTCRHGLRLACVDGPVFELRTRLRKPASGVRAS